MINSDIDSAPAPAPGPGPGDRLVSAAARLRANAVAEAVSSLIKTQQKSITMISSLTDALDAIAALVGDQNRAIINNLREIESLRALLGMPARASRSKDYQNPYRNIDTDHEDGGAKDEELG